MARRTPLHARHEAAGARFVPFAGFDMPVWYTGLRDEHERVRAAVGLFDVSHMGEVRVQGPDAAAVLDRLVTNDMAGMDIGQARYTLMCNPQGGVVDDLVVYRLAADDFLVVVNAANRDKDFAFMQAHADGQATLTDEGDDWVQLAVQGPRAQATMAGLTGVDLDGLDGFRHVRTAVAGVDDCLLARTGYTGEDGFEVYGPAAHAQTLWDAIVEAGAPHDLLPVGLGARDTLRLEVCYPLYGHELNDELGPHQAKLMWTVKLDKPGGFVGRDAIARRRETKADTHYLAKLVIDGKRVARDGMTVLQGDEQVGWVTSGTRSPTLDRSIAMAYVRRGLGRPGTRLAIDVRGRRVDAHAIKGPFYSRDA